METGLVGKPWGIWLLIYSTLILASFPRHRRLSAIQPRPLVVAEVVNSLPDVDPTQSLGIPVSTNSVDHRQELVPTISESEDGRDACRMLQPSSNHDNCGSFEEIEADEKSREIMSYKDNGSDVISNEEHSTAYPACDPSSQAG